MDSQSNKIRLAEECARLDKEFERELAEEVLWGELEYADS